jgi:DNA repair protein RadC
MEGIMYARFSTNLPLVREATEIIINTPSTISDHFGDIADLAQESFQIATLNAKNKMIQRHMITLGIVDASLVHPREVLRPCLLDGACDFAMFHNHPSGDVTPSAVDIRMTRQIVDSAKTMDIPAMDHLILGKTSGRLALFSMREEGILDFS